MDGEIEEKNKSLEEKVKGNPFIISGIRTFTDILEGIYYTSMLGKSQIQETVGEF